MTNPEMLTQFTAAFEALQQRLASGIAAAPPGQIRDGLTALAQGLAESFAEAKSNLPKLQEQLAAARKKAEDAVAAAKAEAARIKANPPAPRSSEEPKPEATPVIPHLEDQLRTRLLDEFAPRKTR